MPTPAADPNRARQSAPEETDASVHAFDLERLVELTERLIGVVDNPEEVRQAALELFARRFPDLDALVLWLPPTRAEPWEVQASVGLHDGTTDSPLSSGPIESAGTMRDPLVINDLSAPGGKHPVALGELTGGLVAIPLVGSAGLPIGQLVAYSFTRREWPDHQVSLLTRIGRVMALTWDRVLRFRETLRIALEDGLTGLYNRRYFNETLAREVARARRYDVPISLLMLDIDHFKRYNDTFGHLVGDEVLRRVARLLTLSLRKSDVLARYGGEEFIVLLPETSLADAREVAEKVRKAVEGAVIPGSESQPMGKLTISVGVAALSDLSEATPQALVERADMRLYDAKARGRNRVSATDPADVPPPAPTDAPAAA